MMSVPTRLPSLIMLDHYGGDWQRYIDAVFAVFHSDFIAGNTHYNGKKILLIGRDKELVQGKERRFWHCVSDGKIEDDRPPDFRRCERIPWMRPVIENAADVTVDVWVERQDGKRDVRPHLWFNEEYLVVLESLWKGDYRPITTFPTDEKHQIRKYRRRRDKWQKKNAAQEDGV